jgi:hypothetical protein
MQDIKPVELSRTRRENIGKKKLMSLKQMVRTKTSEIYIEE